MNQYSNLVSMHGQFPCAPQMYGLSSRSRDSFLLLIGPAALSSTLYVCSVPYTSGVLVVPMSSRLARLPLVSRSSSAHSAQLSSNSCAGTSAHLFVLRTRIALCRLPSWIDISSASATLVVSHQAKRPTTDQQQLHPTSTANG